jgi:hypothetical protein
MQIPPRDHRIMKAAAAPVGTPWLWALAFGHHEDRAPTPGLQGDTRGRAELAKSLAAGRRDFATAAHGRRLSHGMHRNTALWHRR